MHNGTTHIDTAILASLSSQLAWQYKVVPFQQDVNAIHMYGDQAVQHEQTCRDLNAILGKQVQVHGVSAEELSKLLSKYYIRSATGFANLSGSGNGTDFFQKLIQQAIDEECSDVHVEAYEETDRIRFRIDGHLVERYQIRKEEFNGFINQIKVKANLDISEKRLPQDGRIQYKERGEDVDLRVSVLPTMFGEKVVMRLLMSKGQALAVDSIGMNADQLEIYESQIQKPNGIVLISGPTGSGKTTTLYSTLQFLNQTDKNILTIEDPIEYTMEGINQVQLKEKIGLGFPRALRTFLRQDPDIIMVGEIRDAETAEMAIRASLTGHLVFSTIHTNSARLTISRLLDMGIPGFLLSDTLNLSVAQRLVRKLCTNCKQSVSNNEYAEFEIKEHFKPIGCDQCHYTGYKGRKAIFDLVAIDDDLRKAIRKGDVQPTSENGLRNAALELVKTGVTSMEEVYAIISML